MKVGLLTWFWSTNYGGELQALALQCFLAKHGVDAELVNYRVQQTDLSLLGLFRTPFMQQGWRGFVLGIFYRFLVVFVNGYFLQRCVRLFRCRRFVERYMTYSRTEYPDYRALCSETLPYDVVIVGSDQVWNPNMLDVNASYLMGALPGRVRRIAYAASVAVSRIEKRREAYELALPRYYAISVREAEAIEDLEQLSGGRDIAWVVDPSQLLSAQEWCQLLGVPAESPDRSHLFVYWLSSLEDVAEQLCKLAYARKQQVLLYMGDDSFSVEHYSLKGIMRHLKARRLLEQCPYIRVLKSADARDFIRDLRSAQNVLSDSFHALMFSVIFQKNAKIYISESRRNMSSRIYDFLRRAELGNVVIDSIEKDPFETDSGCLGDSAALRLWRKESAAWLLRALKV